MPSVGLDLVWTQAARARASHMELKSAPSLAIVHDPPYRNALVNDWLVLLLVSTVGH